jgi:ubiquitin-protein ligase
MQSSQANAPLLEEVDKNDDSDSSSTHAEPVDSHVERGEITPQEPAGTVYNFMTFDSR